jgi:hypothetical protein
MFYVQLITGLIVRSKVPFKFDGNGWSENIDVATRFVGTTGDDPNYSFFSTANFSFRRDSAVAYWGE